MKKKIKNYLVENNITSLPQLQDYIEELRNKTGRTVYETQSFFDLVGAVCNNKSDLDWYFFNSAENKEVDKAIEGIKNSLLDTGLLPFIAQDITSPIQVFYYSKKDEQLKGLENLSDRIREEQNLKSLQQIMDDEQRPTNWEVLQKYIGKPKKEKQSKSWEDLEKGVTNDIKDMKESDRVTEEVFKMYGASENNAGIKETEGKLDHSEINLDILDLMAERFMANKHKYPKGNSKKEIAVEGLVQAMFRHIKKMIKPPLDDEETFEDHLAAVLCGGSMVLDQLERNRK